MADALTGVQTGGDDVATTLDYLGKKQQLSFSGQPALPQVGAPASLSATPSPSIAGSGVLAPPTSFGDAAKTAGQGPPVDSGGSGGEGTPGDSVGGQATDAAGGPANLGLGFGFGPAQISLSPSGTLGVGGRTGNTFADAALSVGKSALGLAGIQSSVNIPSLVAGLVGSPMLGMVAQAFGAFGLPLTIASIAHAIASMSPTSVTSLQAALADPNPEAQISAAQALALTLGGQMGPTYGGPQAPSGIPGQYGGFNQSPSFYAGFPQAEDVHAPGVPQGPPGQVAPPTAPPTVPEAPTVTVDAPTGTGGVAGPGAGTAGPTGSDVGESGGSASEG